MTLKVTIIGLVMAGILLAGAVISRAQPKPVKARVGTYDSRAVCIAARNSPAFGEPIHKLQADLKDAQAAKDDKRIAQIKQRGNTLQTIRHMQGFSTLPVDDLLLQIKDKLPQVAQQAGVDIIVDRVNFAGDGVETVDVTDALVRAFEPDARTLKTVEELRKHKPITIAEALEIKD